jgi:hypothetical protein
MEIAHKLDRNPEMDEADASRLVRSVHPFLGWICCISAVSGSLQSNTLDGGPNEPVSWTAASMDKEAALLESFWQAVARFPKGTRWATFNGKRFDVPFVEARSAAHGIAPTRQDLRNTYPYGHTPHADLAWLWPQHYSLEGLCGLLDVPSPKSGVDGSGVADLVASGRIGEVAAYCERDVVATFRCTQSILCSALLCTG